MGVPDGGSSAIRKPREKENGSSEWNNYARFSGPCSSLFKGRMRPVTGCHQDHPIRAAPTPVVKPASLLNAANLGWLWAPFRGPRFSSGGSRVLQLPNGLVQANIGFQSRTKGPRTNIRQAPPPSSPKVLQDLSHQAGRLG